MEEYLFNTYDLGSVKDAHEQRLFDEIQGAPEEHVLQVDVDAWAAALAAKWRLDCPQVDADGMYQDDPKPCQVDVSGDRGRYFGSSLPFVAGHQTTVYLPFSGDPDLFQMRPSTFTMAGTPKAETSIGYLSMGVSYPDDRPLNIGAEARRWAEEIQKHLRWMEGDLDGFEEQLRRGARSSIVSRKESIIAHRQHLAETGLPTKPGEKATKTYVAEAIERRPPPPANEMSLEVPLPLEPVISDEMYDDIVGTLRNTAVGMERSAGTYADMGEEDLRQVMLLPFD